MSSTYENEADREPVEMLRRTFDRCLGQRLPTEVTFVSRGQGERLVHVCTPVSSDRRPDGARLFHFTYRDHVTGMPHPLSLDERRVIAMRPEGLDS